jgi:enamine deaminase RidA (YjgF/YER057c/UK114 family)
MKLLQPPDWPRPKGYANGIAARGTLVCLSGIVGWNSEEKFVSNDFVGQVRQALQNIVAILKEAHARPEHIARMTWYVLDKQAYMSSGKEMGRIYREIIGSHYPAMSVVEVSGLVEANAQVEIEVTAVVPD